MKYCQYCGQELMDEAVVCPKCGCPVPNSRPISTEKDAPNIGWAILGFFIPIVGLILYLVWKQDTPLKAKSAGKGALIGVIVEACLVVLSIILSVVLASIAISSAAVATMAIL